MADGMIASSEEQEQDDIFSIEDEVKSIIKVFLTSERDNKEEGFRSVSPSVLIDNSFILAKGRVYEKIMSDLLQNSNPTELCVLERIDEFLSGFIQAERKSRSRLKLNYIISGASSGRLEDAIKLLSESEEIDSDLLSYIDGLIRRKMNDSNNIHETKYNDDGTIVDNSYDHGDDDTIANGDDALSVLKMVRKRLDAEIKMPGQTNLRLLAMLLAEKDTEKHKVLLKENLHKVQEIERFEVFVRKGIDHFIDSSKTSDKKTNIEEKEEDDTRGNVKNIFSDEKKEDGQKVETETVARMKDILETVAEILPSMTPTDIFEISDDDIGL